MQFSGRKLSAVDIEMASGGDKPSMNWAAQDLLKEWRRFKQHCEFTFKGPLAGKSEVEKVNYLMTYIGDKGREIYQTFEWTPARQDGGVNLPPENETLDGVYNKYEQYVKPKRNQIRATVNFNRRKQQEGENFSNFVTDLRILIQDCDYKEEDRMLRDAIVLRSWHPSVREKCLEEGDALTLQKAIHIGQNFELAQDSMKIIKEEETHAVHQQPKDGTRSKGKPPYNNRRSQKPKVAKQKANVKKGQLCSRCGYSSSHAKCPAMGQTCIICKKLNHFAAVCRQKKDTHMVRQEAEYPDDSDYAEEIKAIDPQDGSENDWYEDIDIMGTDVKAQIDTGSARSIMPSYVFNQLGCKKKLRETRSKFSSYSNHELEVLGSATLPTTYKDNCVDVEYFVIKAKNKPVLLSGEASAQLQLISRLHSIDEYPELKQLTGCLPGTYSIKIDPTVKPVVHAPRRQPKALAQKVFQKLEEMEREGHIAKVKEPTDWVNSMVTVVKGDKVRICLDPRDLNRAVRREHYKIPTVEEIVADMPGATVFSVVDAKSGFLQIKIDYESSLLTTFNTPVGRYRWLRLPFGIKCAPEVFQRIMDEMLSDIEGARAVMDDILIAGKDLKTHNEILGKVVKRATEWNLKLNFDKCQIRKNQVKYVGHLITDRGLAPDPDKVRAVREMKRPENKEDVKRFLGFVQYLSKFIDQLSDVDEPLRQLTKKDVAFHWGQKQEESFQKLKHVCTEAPVLAFYDGNKELTIQCDASSFAVGGVLLQDGQPIAYTSRAMTTTESRYAQIEKEMLAILHSCKKFHHYILGRSVVVHTDHKPLQSIFNKPLLAAPLRLQTMMLRLYAYDLDVQYKPGKEIPVGDALSRANLPDVEPDMPPLLVNMLDHIAVSPDRYAEFQKCTANELNELRAMIQKGWPDTKQETPHAIRDFWSVRDELAVVDGVIYKGMRIVVPPSMRNKMLSHIHASHLGIVKCKQRAREALYWPSMNQHIERLVQDCAECNTYQNKQPAEPMKATNIPELPWIELGSDLFEWNGESYLITVDYFSKFIEVDHMRTTTSAAVIEGLKSQFARHGIPMRLRTDNGPQYSSQEFKRFCASYQIEHVTSSPRYPQSNGEAERAVQTVKRLWRKCDDKQLALLDYRTSPLASCNKSPAQLLMGRRPRNLLPASKHVLRPQSNSPDVLQAMETAQGRNESYYNKAARSTDLPVLHPGDSVRISPFPGSNKWLPGTVVRHHDTPKSYVVEHGGKCYRRNRRDLRLTTEAANKPHRQPPEGKIWYPPALTFQQAKMQDVPAATPDHIMTPKAPRSSSTASSQPAQQRSDTSSSTQGSTQSHYQTRSGRLSKPPTRLIMEK